MSEQDDLIGDLIAEVARSHGVAISRDDPVVAVVLLNQIVLRRYLEDRVAPVSRAIRKATNDAVRQIEQFAEAQATWLARASLRDRASLLEEQKALHGAWKADVETLIEGQNTALRQVVMQAATSLQTHKPSGWTRLATADVPQAASASTGDRPRVPWGSISVGILLRTAATVTLTAVGWLQSSGQ